MAKLTGTISIAGLPPHRGLVVSLCFFGVPAPDSPAPYNGDPPAEAATDCEKTFERVDLEKESVEATSEHRFAVERPPGYYYVQVRAILFRSQHGKMLAQSEAFFFGRRPVRIAAESDDVVAFPVSWSAARLEELHHYGTVRPQAQRP